MYIKNESLVQLYFNSVSMCVYNGKSNQRAERADKSHEIAMTLFGINIFLMHYSAGSECHQHPAKLIHCTLIYRQDNKAIKNLGKLPFILLFISVPKSDRVQKD